MGVLTTSPRLTSQKPPKASDPGPKVVEEMELSKTWVPVWGARANPCRFWGLQEIGLGDVAWLGPLGQNDLSDLAKSGNVP